MVAATLLVTSDVGNSGGGAVDGLGTIVVDFAIPSQRDVHAHGDGAVAAIDIVFSLCKPVSTGFADDGDIVEAPEVAISKTIRINI